MYLFPWHGQTPAPKLGSCWNKNANVCLAQPVSCQGILMGLTSLIWGLHLHSCLWTQEPQFSWALGCQCLSDAQAELCLCLSRDLVDPDRDQQADFPDWPLTCLVNGHLPSSHCALSSPGYLIELDSDLPVGFPARVWSCLISTVLPGKIWILGRIWLPSAGFPCSPWG